MALPFLLLERSRCIGTARDTPLGTASAASAGASRRAVTRGDAKRRGELWLLPEQSQGRLQGMPTAPCMSAGARLQAVLKAPLTPSPKCCSPCLSGEVAAQLGGGRAGRDEVEKLTPPWCWLECQESPARVPAPLHRRGYLPREPEHGAWPLSTPPCRPPRAAPK